MKSVSVPIELLDRITRPQLKPRDETVRRRAITELRALLDKEVDGDSHAPKQQGEPVAELQVAFFEHSPMATINLFTSSAFESGATKLYAEQPAPVAKSRCEQVPFSMLCYGAKFKYTPGESAVFVKIGPDLVAGWDGQKVADGWIGQPVCSFSDDGNLLAAVTLVNERPEPVAVVMPESMCPSEYRDSSYTQNCMAGEYNRALDDVVRLNVVKS